MDTWLIQTHWIPQLAKHLRSALKDDSFWSNRLALTEMKSANFGLHLAIFVEPYLQYILEGKKTIESRFGANRRAPFGYVKEGDVLLLKKSGGPITGICLVGQVWFYRLDPTSWNTIKDTFSTALCAQDPSFWRERRGASFATLMLIKEVRSLTPFEIPKKDRRGWVTLKGPTPRQEMLFA